MHCLELKLRAIDNNWHPLLFELMPTKFFLTMLNRRYLRIKVLQALYSWYQGGEDIARSEKELFKSIEKINDLYLHLLALLIEVVDAARLSMDHAREKQLPTEADLDPNTRFVDNPVVALIENNIEFRRAIDTKKINWSDEREMIRKIFRAVRDSGEYDQYMSKPQCSFEDHRDLIVKIFKKFVAGSEYVHDLMEDRNIYWYDDITLAGISVSKTLSAMKENTRLEDRILSDLYKEEKEDRIFMRDLLQKTVKYDAQYTDLISEKTKNWEVDRIARVDVILMKMALCELHHFKTVPVKVTLNEYIEISKLYSTPKSKHFINGILDKLLIDLKTSGKMKKAGRGLVE